MIPLELKVSEIDLDVFLPQSSARGVAMTAFLSNPIINAQAMLVEEQDTVITGNLRIRRLFNQTENYLVGFMTYTPVGQTFARRYLLRVGPRVVDEVSDGYEINPVLNKLGVTLLISDTDSSLVLVSSRCFSPLVVQVE